MLAPQKIAKKKIVVSFIIMTVMLGGTTFLLYQNHLITSRAKGGVAAPPVMDTFSQLDKRGDVKQKETPVAGTDLSKKTTTASSTPAASSKNKTFDTSIFTSGKFQALKEAVTGSSSKITVGRKNPFESY